MPKKKPLKGDPEVNEALKGFDIRIDEFGEITSNFEIDRINKFLNENVPDKKLPEKQGKDAKHPETNEEEEEDQG
ncbi:MAG: hypothetical protein IPL49_03165 [Saprospirales bacterium]|nr:hypothetical protein [Saprospirales bacterium]